jgi:hypothetical protein
MPTSSRLLTAVYGAGEIAFLVRLEVLYNSPSSI